MSRITPETAPRYIQSFSKNFGEAHLYLACHAALPIALTPDLLYLLWKNFQYDINGQQLNIPWIAVADLLLSGFCHEVGHELYEMDLPVRNILLKNLQNNQNFGKARINNISNFLLEYIKPQLASTDQDIQDLAQTQRLTALAYLNPEQAARELTIAFAKTNQKYTTELLRITSLVETLAKPLYEYEDLLLYSRGLVNFLHGKIEDATIQFLELIGDEAEVTVSGISLPIPEPIKANFSIIETSPNKYLPIIGGGFSAFLITILGNFALQYRLQPIFLKPIIPNPTITNSPVPVNINPNITSTPEPTITKLPLTNNIPTTLTPDVSSANQSCQSPVYINRRLNLRPPFAPLAEQYGSVLQRNGYQQVSFPPRPGDVVVFQSGALGAFPGGHVGIVEGTRQVRSANQPGNRTQEAGCNNVSVWELRGGMNPRDLGGRVTFWRR